jgi:hypothetical protein
MRPSTCIKDVQKLMGCLAALSRFISTLAEQALSFFKLLWKSGPFVWTEEVEEAFQELKWYLTSLPIMVAPEPGEPLLLYITATADVMSMVLVMEWPDPKAEQESMSQPLEAHPALKHGDGPDTIVECPPLDANLGADNQEVTRSQLSGAISDSGGQEHPKHVPMEVDTPDPRPRRVRTIQRPVYYISEVLHEAKTRNLEVHKLLYVVLIGSRKLHHYFQAHKISMVSSYPLRVVLHNPNATGNIAK